MNSRQRLAAFVFTTGLVITAIEITASRALAPYFGTSLFVWANVIGITLVALALGYSVGGKLADRRPRLDVLAFIVLAAGIYSSLIPILVQGVARSLIASTLVAGLQFSIIFASFFAAALLFFPPIFLLGMVSPFAIRLAADRVEGTGRTAGTIFAASTVGSILGIFLPAFYLIPFVGVRETFYLGSGVLILLAAIALRRRAVWVIAFIAIPITLFFLTKDAAIRPDGVTLEERDTAYQYVRVTQRDDGTVALRINDGLGVQSLYHPDYVLTGSYYDYYSLLPYVRNNSGRFNVLLVGLAGGTISRQLDEIAGQDVDVHIDGVEIDPGVVALARQYFALDRDRLDVHVADGRMFLARSEEKYQLIVTDAYSQQIYIPPHLVTREYFQLAADHLADGGIFAINVNAFRDDAELIQRILLTLQDVFPHVLTQRLPESANHLVLAANQPIDLANLAERVPALLKPLATVVAGAKPPAFAYRSEKILTDNRSSAELLTEAMFFDFIEEI